jgi:hypothetical protein
MCGKKIFPVFQPPKKYVSTTPLGIGLWFFQFHDHFTDGKTPWTGDQPIARPLPTRRTTQTQNKCTQTFMPWVGVESMPPGFERLKTVHALDRVANHGCTVTSFTVLFFLLKLLFPLELLRQIKSNYKINMTWDSVLMWRRQIGGIRRHLKTHIWGDWGKATTHSISLAIDSRSPTSRN